MLAQASALLPQLLPCEHPVHAALHVHMRPASQVASTFAQTEATPHLDAESAASSFASPWQQVPLTLPPKTWVQAKSVAVGLPRQVASAPSARLLCLAVLGSGNPTGHHHKSHHR